MLPSNLSNEPTSLDVTVSEVVSEAFYAQSSYSLKVVGGANDGQAVVINALTKISDTSVRLTLATPLTAGNYQLAIASEVKDTAGNSLANQTLDFTATPPTLAFAPLNGEGMVSLTRDGVVRFGTKVKPETVTNEAFYLIANGQRLAGKVKVSSTNEFATFLPDEILPASTEVRMVVDGSKILSQSGVAIDADGDGLVGGIGTADFTTLPIVRIAGTDVWGYVYDSYNKNPDGTDKPLEGVEIRLDFLPDVKAVTDANGYFILEDVPAPEFFVYIDGSKAANVPAGTQYASLGKAFHSVPGQSTQLFMDGVPFNIYLPPMFAGDVKALSTTENTDVGFGDASKALLQQALPDIDPSVWDEVKVTFAPGSAQDREGNAATQAMIVPVAPDRLPAPLPPGVDPKLVISIQAGGENGFNREAQGGSTTFDVPAPLQFPNLEGLQPGEKALFWSFDHVAGDWTVIGTGTVSADGKVITSDPGVGVLAPGWHFVNPGVPADGDPPEDPDDLDWDEIADILNQDYESKKGTAGAALAHQIKCIAETACENEDTWGGDFVKEVFEDIAQSTRDLDLPDFLPNALPGIDYSDRLIEKLPNWVLELFGVEIIRVGDVSAVLGGFGRHFPYELLPGFIRHCQRLNDDDHNSFFNDAVVPCFDQVVADGELSPWAGDIAQGIVPPSATVLRETVQALCPVFDFFGLTESSSLSPLSSTEDAFPVLPDRLTKDDLYSEEFASISTLKVDAGGLFFVPVGGEIQLQVTKENSDGTVTDLTSANSGTKYFALVGDETVEITPDGIMSILGTPSPITSMTPVLYVIVRNGDDIGFGQFAVTDIDSDGDLIVDSFEEKWGLDPNVKNSLNSDLDNDGLSDLYEVLSGINPLSSDTDRDGIDDRSEIINETGALNRSQTHLNPIEGSHYYAIKNLDNDFVQRGRTSSSGKFENLVLAPNTEYQVSVLNLETLEVGFSKFTTPNSGVRFKLPSVILGKSLSLDTDIDGLSDDAEFVIGTSLTLSDTDNDGINDFAEIQQGLDPLGGQGFPTGIIASLPLLGEAKGVVIEGSTTNTSQQIAYVATGSHGLAIVNASQFNNPIILGQLNLAGDATDVAVDANLKIAAVASNNGGLQLVDVSDPMLPVLKQTININASQVEVVDGIAYATVGTSLRAVDLLSGEQIQQVTLPSSGTVTGLARDGSYLYGFISGPDIFFTVDISNSAAPTLKGQLTVSIASTDVGVFAGNGIASLAGSGLSTSNSHFEINRALTPILAGKI